MKIATLTFFLAATAMAGGVFEFKDLEGYEKCLRTEGLAEKTKTSTGEETQYLNATDVQIRCVTAAAKLLKGEKNGEKVKSFIQATKVGTAPENAIELVEGAVKTDVKRCNDIALYEVIHKAISHPSHDSPASNYQKAVRSTKTCLKDAEFKKDFLDEKDSSDSYVSANACAILKAEKLVADCKKS